MNIAGYDSSIQKYDRQYQVYAETDDPRAIGVLKRMLKYARENSDNELSGYVYNRLAFECYKTGDYKAFLKNLRQAASAVMRSADKSEMIKIYYHIAVDALNRDMFDVAYDYTVHARNSALRENCEDDAAVMDAMTAYILLQTASYEECLTVTRRSLEEVIKYKSRPNYVFNVVSGYLNEAAACLGLSRDAEAEKAYEKAVRFVENTDDDYREKTTFDLGVIGARIAVRAGNKKDLRRHTDAIKKGFNGEMQLAESIGDIELLGRELLESGEAGILNELLQVMTREKISEDLSGVRRVLTDLRVAYCLSAGSREQLDAAYREQDIVYGQIVENRKAAYNYVRDLISLTSELNAEQETIRMEREQLLRMANTDALTGIANRHALNGHLEKLFEQAFREKTSLGVLMIDLDELKNYNDTYGHQAGDRCLIRVGDALSALAEDERVFPARYGGDEFVVLFDNMTDREIRAFCTELQERVPLTVSQGVCNAVPREKNRSWDYLSSADRALYRSKKYPKENKNRKIRFAKLPGYE